MRVFAIGALVLAVAACTPPVPDSGVGFDTQAQMATRDAQLQSSGDTGSGDTGTQQAGTGQAGAAQAGATGADPGAQPMPRLNNAGISDTQNFTAVKDRLTIEKDKALLAAQRQQYRVIAPTALPPRPASTGPSIVEFALSTTNSVGDSLYRRSSLFAEARYNRNCAKYPSPDKAQEAFLRAGGPKRDPMGLDPDGDGFACSWDPAPFRLVRK